MVVLLLGVGRQGKAALHDLARSEVVTGIIAADQDIEMLEAHVARQHYSEKVRCHHLNAARSQSLARLVRQGADVIIDLLPVRYCAAVALAAIGQGVHLVNTFYVLPELARLADGAEARNVTILPEFGMDPGIDLVLLGEAVRALEEVDSIVSYGAGVPEPAAAVNPLRYKVTWTFEGVLRSYIRAARLIRDGRIVTVDEKRVFHSENVHDVAINGLGTLEAFPNGDAPRYAKLLGLEIPRLRKMGRYALRWPGHSAFWKKMVDLHLLDDAPVEVDGVAISRRRFLAAAIEPHIQLGPAERDVVIVRVEVEGRKKGRRVRLVRQMIDRRDLKTGLTAMSRTVGFTASIGAQMIGSRMISRPGLLSPVNDVPYAAFLAELRKRGIEVTEELTPL